MHHRSARLLAILLFPLVAAAAQPVITSQGPVNSASYRSKGLPGSGIAQGSIFAIFGTGLGPDSFVGATTFPLSTSLGGSSASITVGGTSVPAIIVFAYSTQLNAILPSSTPIGTGTITVTYHDQTSDPVPIEVVASAFGIYAYNSAGTGQAIATDTNYDVNTIVHTFHPGDYVSLWGTGLGSITASDTQPPPAGSLPVSAIVHIGNSSVVPDYHGRAPCCAGLDQVVFQVPAGVSGCHVPVGVEVGGVTGSVATVAVSANGQTCGDSLLGQDLVNQLAAGQKVKFGYVRLESYLTQGAGQAGADIGLATFSELSPDRAGSAQYGVSNGYCYAVDCSHGCALNGANWSGSLADASPAQLDAGPLAVVSASSMPLTQFNGFYAAQLSGNDGSRFLWSNLDYQVTGPGGANIGALTAQDTTAKLTVQFSNIANRQVLPRANDLLLRWTGGDPALQNGQVTIGALSASADFTQLELLQCTAPLSAGQFTIPAWILSGLPASGQVEAAGGTFPAGYIWIGQYNKPTVFTAPGLDRGIVTDVFYNRTEIDFH